MSKNKNKRPVGLTGHNSNKDFRLTSLQNGLYWIRIMTIIHNFNHPQWGHDIYNFAYLPYLITTIL